LANFFALLVAEVADFQLGVEAASGPLNQPLALQALLTAAALR
jgi:hypothetical protein